MKFNVSADFFATSPNKGIEIMIDAMRIILAACRNAVYVVLGAMHPILVLEQVELRLGMAA